MSPITALLLNLIAPGLWATPEISTSDEQLAVAQGRPIQKVDLGRAEDKASMMDALARDLNLPDYFGKNFDALEECLADLDSPSRVVVLANGDKLKASHPELVETLNAVFADHAAVSGRSFVWLGSPDQNAPVMPDFWSSL